MAERQNDGMTDSCKYRFLFYILKKKPNLSTKRFPESMIKTTFLANVCPKIYGKGGKELPLKRVWENADRIYAEINWIACIPVMSLQNLEKWINKIVDKTFNIENIDHFQINNCL